MNKILLIIALVFIAAPAIACTTDGLYPDKECTPGDIFEEVGTEQICVKGYSATVRNVPKSVKNSVYEMYGIPKDQRKFFVIDHLISLQIGGTNEIPNLFPQRTTGKINSRTKDKIENFLKREVCKGNITLKEAQRLIVDDWLAVYEDFTEVGE
jgi:hypothetical protein